MQAQDILQASRQLEKSGMERSQAEAVAEILQTAVSPLATNKALLATNESLAATNEALGSMKTELQAEMSELRSEMHQIQIEVYKFGTTLTWRLATAVFAIEGLWLAFERTLG